MDPLDISLLSLQRLLNYHQVMPSVIEFLGVYGDRSGLDKELLFSGFRTEVVLSNPLSGNVIPEIGRSGRQYQMCYNLKTVVLKPNNGRESKEWKIRQEAIHHQFDVGSGHQFWLFGDPHSPMQRKIDEMIKPKKGSTDIFKNFGSAFKSSLEVHLKAAQWATEGWRQYVLFLEQKILELVSDTVLNGQISSHKND
jgi:hypothetical protein